MDSTIEAAMKTVEQAKATVDEGISATAHGLSHGAAVAGSVLAQASDGLRNVLDQGQVRERQLHSTRVWVRAHLAQSCIDLRAALEDLWLRCTVQVYADHGLHQYREAESVVLATVAGEGFQSHATGAHWFACEGCLRMVLKLNHLTHEAAEGLSWSAANPYVAYPAAAAGTLLLLPCE